MPIVDEIVKRQRYNTKFRSTFKRFISCLDKDADEEMKKMRYLASKKLQNELDVTRIIRKIRNFEVMSSYLLTERQKYLMRFN